MDREKVIKQLENDAMATDTGYVEVPLLLFSEILALLKEQEAEIRQLRLALDIAKGTCKGIIAEGR